MREPITRIIDTFAVYSAVIISGICMDIKHDTYEDHCRRIYRLTKWRFGRYFSEEEAVNYLLSQH